MKKECLFLKFIVCSFLSFSSFSLLSQSIEMHSISKYIDNGSPQRIIGGGFIGGIEDAPWMVSISTGGTLGFIGGGVILDSKTILTAGHVVDNFENSPHVISVFGGTRNPGVCETCSVVEEVLLFEDYDNSGAIATSDLAILKLVDHLEFSNLVQSISFANSCNNSQQGYYFGTSVDIYGWGGTDPNSNNSAGSLKTANLSVFDIESSNFWDLEWTFPNGQTDTWYSSFFDDSMVALNSSDSQAYFGDSGGPAVALVNGTPTLIGIISWGADPSLIDVNEIYPTICANVSVAEEFIRNNLELDNCSPAPEITLADITNTCPELYIGLEEIFTGQIPQGMTLVWSDNSNLLSCDDNYSSGVITETGEYFLYFYDNENDCFSSSSTPIQVTISSCCNIQSAITITSDVTFEAPIAYAMGVTINNGGTLTVTDRLEIGTNGSVTVNSGGILIIEDEGQITKCSSAQSWEGVIVNNGGTLIVDIGSINYASNGIRAFGGSSVDLSEIGINGPNGNIGINLQENVNLINAEDVFISNYGTGILARNATSYYEFNHGSIINVSTGIRLFSSPARINGYTIRSEANGIGVSLSSGTLIQNNEIYASLNQDIPAVTYGIDADYSNSLVIIGNTIGSIQTPVMVGIDLKYSNSSIISENNRITTRLHGIHSGFSDVTINQNEINTRVNSIGGIFVFGSSGNQIKNNFIDAIGANFGISTVSCNGAEIENNDILGVVVTGLNRVAAIRSTASTGQTIAGNNIYGYGRTTGILAHNTTGNIYDCNYVENGDEGLGIYYNSLGQTIRGNSYEVGGNDLAIRSVTGWQRQEGNEFVGGNAWAEDIDIANDSKFFVNPNIAYHKPANPDPANGWFEEEPTVYNHYVCSGSPGPNWTPFWDDEEVVCAYYHKVISVHGYGSPEYIRMMMTMKRYNAFNSDWFIYECIGDPVPPECMDTLISIEFQILDFFNNSDRVNSDNLRELVLSMSDEIEILNNSELSSLSNNENQRMAEDLESFDNQLEEWKKDILKVDCDDVILEKSKEIILAYIQRLKSDQEIINYDELINLSRLCSDDYGAYVHIARTFANESTDEHFDQYDNCREAQVLSRSSVNDKFSHNIFPNPSTGLVSVAFNEAVRGQLSVVDIKGQILITKFIEDIEIIKLDLSSFQGINIIQFVHENGKIEYFKAIITN